MKKNAYADWNQILNDLKSITSTKESITAAKPYLANHVFVLDSEILPGKPDAIAYVSTEEEKIDPATGKFKITIVNPVLQTFFDEYFKNIPNVKNYQDLNKPENKELKESFLEQVGDIVLHEGAHIPPGGKYDPTKPAGGTRDEGYARSQEKLASRGVTMKKQALKILNKLAKDLNSSGQKSLATDVGNILKKYAEDPAAGRVETPGPAPVRSPLADFSGMDSDTLAALMEFQRIGDERVKSMVIRPPNDPYTYYFDPEIKKFKVKTSPSSLPGGQRIAPPGSIINNKSAEAYLKSLLDSMLGKVHFQYGIPMSSDEGPVSLNPDTGALMIGADYQNPTGTGEVPRWSELYLETLRAEYDRYKASTSDSGIRIARNIKRWLDVAEAHREYMDKKRAEEAAKSSEPETRDMTDPVWGPLNPPSKPSVTPVDATDPENPWGTVNPAMDKMSKAKVEVDVIKKIAAMKEVYDQAMIFGEKNPFGRTNTKYKG